MLFLYALFIILINISKEDVKYDVFPLNEEFKIINSDENNKIINIYLANIMAYFEINVSNDNRSEILKLLNSSNSSEFDFKYMNFTFNISGTDNSSIVIAKCNKSEIKACIENFNVGYGEQLFARFIYLPFLMVFIGVFLCLYGRAHYIFSIYFEFAGCFYFFMVDLFELFITFDSAPIPFYLLSAGLISGFLIAILGNMSIKNLKILSVTKIIKACIIGYYFIKSLFYYISGYTPINSSLFFSFICIFMILGGLGEYLLSLKFKTDQIIFILSSILCGSFYITKGISYVVGGYFSDLLTSIYDLKYNDDAKSRVTFFLVLHISLIIGALLFQIIDFNQRKYEEALTRQSTRKSVGYAPPTPKSESLNASKDINSTINENEKADNYKSMSPKESMPEISNGKNGDINNNDVNEYDEINDQDD